MLRGRRAEQSVIDELLDNARSGVSGALVVRGDPGIGKTALLDYAADRADGLRILRAGAAEAEAELPFAALHLLLRPALDRLDVLPGPQRHAVETALGLRAGEHWDRFLVGLATLSLLSELAEGGPLLCVVDDAHWLDQASAQALTFAARRLDAEGIALLIAARDGADGLPAQVLPELRLTGLPEDEATALLADRDDHLMPAARSRVVAEARGNPLALLELPAVLAAGPRDRPPPADPLPLTERLELAFHDRAGRLPDGTRTLLLVAAAEGTGNLDVVLRAAARLGGTGHADLPPAERAGLIQLGERDLGFRHPLVRAAIYQRAPLDRRHAAHRALAAALDTPDGADRRAWHLAAAATGHDEGVAAELERTAVRARERSGYAAAAAAYERAAQLTTDETARGRRLTLAAEAANEAGQLSSARRLARQAGDQSDPALRDRLIQVRADAAVGQGRHHLAHALLIEGAAGAAAQDPRRAVEMLVEATRTAWFSAAPDLAVEAAERLDALRLGPEAAAAAALGLSRWLASLAAGRPVADLPPRPDLAETAHGARPPDTRDLLAGVLTGQDAHALELAAALAAEHRTRGRIGLLPSALYYVATAEMHLGRLHDAQAHATEAREVARDTGQEQWTAQSCGLLAYLAAVAGDEARCRDFAGTALSSGLPPASDMATWALGLLDLGRGQAGSAVARLESLRGPSPRHPVITIWSACDLVEAAVRQGQNASTTAVLPLLDAWAGHLRRSAFDAVLARCRALLSPDDQAEDHFTTALKAHEQDSRPFEHARTELLYGEWLRRLRRKADARGHLRAALEKFERLGAKPWAERTQTELGATGMAAPRSPGPGNLARLTPQELQIVRLASQGLTNRDIAAQLFLSPRTVAYHLYKAYPKLNVTSRTDLAALPLTDAQ
ncbi:ATP-binding protein [Actinomadura rubrisoli]|nr:helix-turn-helix transcriptional regulator [Actinomadura rubrisoli]